MKIALLGAESTGKTQLARELAAQLRRRGRQVVVVDEVLREWCVREGRQPGPAEQLPIALEQERRVDRARVVYGLGADRLANALAAVDPSAAVGAGARPVAAPRWQWNCEKCSDPQCEHRLFTSKIAAP